MGGKGFAGRLADESGREELVRLEKQKDTWRKKRGKDSFDPRLGVSLQGVEEETVGIESVPVKNNKGL